MDTLYRVISDNHSNHNLPVGAVVSFYEFDAFANVNRYTQGFEGDEVAIDPRDLEVITNV